MGIWKELVEGKKRERQWASRRAGREADWVVELAAATASSTAEGDEDAECNGPYELMACRSEGRGVVQSGGPLAEWVGAESCGNVGRRRVSVSEDRTAKTSPVKGRLQTRKRAMDSFEGEGEGKDEAENKRCGRAGSVRYVDR